MDFQEIGGKLDRFASWLDRQKQRAEPTLDKVLLYTGLNAGTVWGAASIVDNSEFSDPTNALLMMGTGAVLTAANCSPKVKEKLSPKLGKANLWLDTKRPLSWAKSLGLAGLVGASLYGLSPYLGQVTDDFGNMQIAEAHVDDSIPDPEPIAQPDADKTKTIEGKSPIVANAKARPEVYNHLGFTGETEINFKNIKLDDKFSKNGRIQRTLRWSPIYNAIEEVYGLEENVLAGMIMEESVGSILLPNSSGDGGIGLTHVQGTTAGNYGLVIYGSSSSAHDPKHGKQINEMLEACNYDIACVQTKDERGHPIKVLDTAARIVTEGKKKHGKGKGSDPKDIFGVEYYRAPAKVGRNTTWKYQDRVYNWKELIEDETAIKKARKDFENRNPNVKFDDYIEAFHETADDWGLETYVNAMKN